VRFSGPQPQGSRVKRRGVIEKNHAEKQSSPHKTYVEIITNNQTSRMGFATIRRVVPVFGPM
ncbi:MAG: hypothetical protein AAFO75_09495, partial [Pseudomonadota bacterium]